MFYLLVFCIKFINYHMENYMKFYRVKCKYAYSILGEKPPLIDNNANYIIIASSRYYPHCVIIQRSDGNDFYGEKNWIVPQNCLY